MRTHSNTKAIQNRLKNFKQKNLKTTINAVNYDRRLSIKKYIFKDLVQVFKSVNVTLGL